MLFEPTVDSQRCMQKGNIAVFKTPARVWKPSDALNVLFSVALVELH